MIKARVIIDIEDNEGVEQDADPIQYKKILNECFNEMGFDMSFNVISIESVEWEEEDE